MNRYCVEFNRDIHVVMPPYIYVYAHSEEHVYDIFYDYKLIAVNQQG